MPAKELLHMKLPLFEGGNVIVAPGGSEVIGEGLSLILAHEAYGMSGVGGRRRGQPGDGSVALGKATATKIWLWCLSGYMVGSA